MAQRYGDDVDTIDIEAIYDATLSESENRAEVAQQYPTLAYAPRRPTKEDVEQLEATHAETWTPPTSSDAPFSKLLDKIGSVAIIGDRNTGKSALAHRTCDTYKARGYPVFAFKHPNPVLLAACGYSNLYRFGDLEDLQDCVLWISEPQIHIPTYDKKANDGLMRLLSLCRQRNVILVLDTSDSRFVTRGLESYIDAWMVKDCDPQLLKQGSKVKKVIQENCLISADGFTLPVEQFLYNARKHPELGGRHRFALPSYWTQAHSTPYRLER